MVELTPDAFLNELVKLFQKTRDQGCVRVTLKRSELAKCLCSGCCLGGLVELTRQACRQPAVAEDPASKPGE